MAMPKKKRFVSTFNEYLLCIHICYVQHYLNHIVFIEMKKHFFSAVIWLLDDICKCSIFKFYSYHNFCFIFDAICCFIDSINDEVKTRVHFHLNLMWPVDFFPFISGAYRIKWAWRFFILYFNTKTTQIKIQRE